MQNICSRLSAPLQASLRGSRVYIFIVALVVAALGALTYYLYIKEKSEKLSKIERGICPQCESPTITLKRSKSGGCSGTSSMIYRCEACGYEEEFNVEKGCGSGGCGL